MKIVKLKIIPKDGEPFFQEFKVFTQQLKPKESSVSNAWTQFLSPYRCEIDESTLDIQERTGFKFQVISVTPVYMNNEPLLED
jgi:hypothetical protein